jgi:hypothetical protein
MITTVDVKSLACAEAERLTRARLLVAARTNRSERSNSGENASDQIALESVEPDRTWIAVARSTPLRMALRGRRLQLWRLGLEDGNGRVAESTLVALSIDGASSPVVGDLAHLVEQSAATWREEAGRTLGQFAAVRVARELAIAAAHEGTIDALQPGLFDRRAERLHANLQTSQSSSRDEERSRLEAIARTTSLSPLPARLLLVLVPHR